ncbi:pentapeptide repeat-containing protein [Amycolatopsis sp. NPDC024027]|uniref:pentapeptide repeat-containing protein n=1 Tax=Amycolatopsis sp. NPDC024027 TaxID=3154327 RepID=UPI0033D3D004
MSGFPLAAAQAVLIVVLIALAVQYVRVFLLRKSAVRRRVPVRATTTAAAAHPPYRHYRPAPETRLETFRELDRRAHQDPAQRQDFVDQVLGELRFNDCDRMPNWHSRLWVLVLPHLRPDGPEFWPGIDLRVEYAVLTAAVDLSGCEVRDLTFDEVRFGGTARFVRTVFTGDVLFAGSCFAGHARFREADFRGAADFDQVTFTGTAAFPGVTVAGPAGFHQARFSGLTDFTGARFAGPFDAVAAGFAGRTSFRDAQFAARTRFAQARFTGHADFTGATFAAPPELARAWARTDWYAVRTWPAGWAAGAEEVVLPKRPGRWAELHG